VTPVERFTAWRDELTVERDTIEAELATTRTDLERAEREHGEALAQRKQLDAFVDAAFVGLLGRQDVAQPLHARIQAARADLIAEPAKRRATLRTQEKSLRLRRLEVQESLDQIERALTADKVAQFPRRSEPSRPRTHAPVEFDTIQVKESHK